MSMNVNTTTAAYAKFTRTTYKTGAAEKKKEVAQTTENTKIKEKYDREHSRKKSQ